MNDKMGIETMLTRAELHELVWQYPISELARQFQVPATSLAKTCEYYYISRPPAGYWQKLAFGKTSEREALDSLRFPAEEKVTILQ